MKTREQAVGNTFRIGKRISLVHQEDDPNRVQIVGYGVTGRVCKNCGRGVGEHQMVSAYQGYCATYEDRPMVYHPATLDMKAGRIIVHLEGNEHWVFSDLKYLGRLHLIATLEEKRWPSSTT